MISRSFKFFKNDWRQIAKYSLIMIGVFLSLSIDLWADYSEGVIFLTILMPAIVVAFRLVFFLLFYRGPFDEAYADFIK